MDAGSSPATRSIYAGVSERQRRLTKEIEAMTNIQDTIRRVLAAEAAAISAIRVTSAFEVVVRLMHTATGKVVCTGMGKAGLVARRFAATLSSTGTPALFLHPSEAQHGDLGVMGPHDLLIAFSTSGKTREVIETIRQQEKLHDVPVVGITSHPDSELRGLASVILDMGEIVEPCPLGLTPTASMAVMGAIADALAIATMELKGLTRTQYGVRHHGGYLGQQARQDA